MLATTRRTDSKAGARVSKSNAFYVSASLTAPEDNSASTPRAYENSRAAYLLSYLPGAVSHLPIISPVALRLSESSVYHRSSTDELVTAAATDPFLSARLIGLANSVAYNTDHNVVRTVSDAIDRIGPERANRVLTEAPRLVLGPTDRNKMHGFWMRCVAVAHAARGLAGSATQTAIDVDAMYWMGLIHDIGHLLEIHYFRKRLGQVIDRILIPGNSMHSLAHAETGSTLAHCWSLPACAAQAIRWHHAPTDCPEGEGKIAAAIIFVADKIVNSAMFRSPLRRNECARALMLAGIPAEAVIAVSESISRSSFALSWPTRSRPGQSLRTA